MPWIEVPNFQPKRPAQAKAPTDRNWYTITNAAAPDEATLYLYDEIGGWFGATAEEFVAELQTVTAPSLRVHVNSPGGSVFEGLTLANALRAHPAHVTVQVDGLAASIASVIAMAADRVEMAPQSMLMIHDAAGACLGDAAEMTKMAEVLDIISDNIADAYAARAGGTAQDWRSAMKAESWYKAQDAVDAGLADAALPAKSAPDEGEPEEMAARFDLAAYGYIGPPKPKPGPPPVKATAEPEPEPAPTLVISIADVLDEDTVQRLREAVRSPVIDASAAAPGTAAPVEAAAGAGVASPEAPAPAAPEPQPEPDGWDAIVANLTAPAADRWAATFSHLTQTASSRATES